MTKLLTLGILFSIAVRAVVAAKLLIPGISPVTSFILALRVILVVKLVISGILSSIFLILALHASFLATSFFVTLLSLLKSRGTSANVSIFNLSSLLFKFLTSSGIAFNLSASFLSTSAFKQAK